MCDEYNRLLAERDAEFQKDVPYRRTLRIRAVKRLEQHVRTCPNCRGLRD